MRVLLSMLQSPSAAVSYEAAWTLVSLSGAPTAIRAVREKAHTKRGDAMLAAVGGCVFVCAA